MTLEQMQVYALQALVVCTLVVAALRMLIAAFARFAEHTLTKADDAAAVKLARWFDGIAAALDVLRRFIPRVVVGPLPRSQPIGDEALSSLPPPPALGKAPTGTRLPRLRRPPTLRVPKAPPPAGGES